MKPGDVVAIDPAITVVGHGRGEDSREIPAPFSFLGGHTGLVLEMDPLVVAPWGAKTRILTAIAVGGARHGETRPGTGWIWSCWLKVTVPA